MSTETAQQKAPLSFNFGMAAFETVIAGNFRVIQSTLAQQQAQIARLSALLQGLQKNIGQVQKAAAQKQSQEGPKTNEIASSSVEGQAIMNEKPSKDTQQGVGAGEKAAQTKQGIIQVPSNSTSLPAIQGESPLLPTSNQINQTDLTLSEVGIKLVSSDIMEEKVFELFERVRLLEEKQSNGERFNLKKFRELDFQLQETVQGTEKIRKGMGEFEEAVEELRNQISEYKLKKESKILKVLNSSAINLKQSSVGENYDYMADKIQFLLKHVSELLTRKSFEEQREALHLALDALRRKLNDAITEGFFQESLKALETRIYQSVAKHLKAMQFAPSEKGEKAEQLDALIEQGNRQFTQRVSEHQQKIKVVSEEVALLQAAVEGSRKQRLQFEEECGQQVRLTQQKCELLGLQLEDVHKFAQEARQSFGQKHLESENQIIQLQESMEKVTANFKSLNFTASNRDTPVKSSFAPNDNPESQLILEKVNSNTSNAELENDFKSQQKKFNKLHGKVQGLKEDILTFREDLMREVDGVKAGLEKKADWESLRKGLNYFEEKLKETKAVTQALYESAGKEEGDSLAVKKGWTCLVCDKDIKSYQGKLGQLKFTSLFPVRESPRIGGYYKQQQASQEYRQVFMSNSNLNNRSRRIGSLKSKESKEELH